MKNDFKNLDFEIFAKIVHKFGKSNEDTIYLKSLFPWFHAQLAKRNPR